MSNTDKKLSELFDIEQVPQTNSLAVIEGSAIQAYTDEDDKKVKYVKDTMVALVEKGKAAIEELHLIARDSEKSRDFEVMFNGMKAITEISEKLIELDGVKKADKGAVAAKTVHNTQNNVFVGTTEELHEFLKNSAINNKN
ncbi:hypothetical protein [Synechococcus phage BUCT-ZZ01]|nr:hypothetical protein [Synechococcus phage BUCT-ZZ01]